LSKVSRAAFDIIRTTAGTSAEQMRSSRVAVEPH